MKPGTNLDLSRRLSAGAGCEAGWDWGNICFVTFHLSHIVRTQFMAIMGKASVTFVRATRFFKHITVRAGTLKTVHRCFSLSSPPLLQRSSRSRGQGGFVCVTSAASLLILPPDLMNRFSPESIFFLLFAEGADLCNLTMIRVLQRDAGENAQKNTVQ